MCNIHFDEQAVRRAFLERAQNDKTPLPTVNPNQIFRDLYDGPVLGIRLHFIKKVKSAMVKEALRVAFAERMKQEGRNLNEIYAGNVARDLFGVSDIHHVLAAEWHEDEVSTVRLAQAVQYDMMIEESQAQAGRAE